MKKIIAVLLLIAISVSPILFSACQNDPADDSGVKSTVKNDESGDSQEEPSETEILPDLPDEDFGGYTLRVTSRGDDWHAYPAHSRDIIATDEAMGDIINDAVYERNLAVQERFNIEISLQTFPELTGDGEAGAINAVKKAHAAGDDTFDLILGHQIMMGTAAMEGYFANWYDMPYIDMTKPWWDQEVKNNLSIGETTFLAMSDMSVSSHDNAYVILFNKQLHENYQLENLYELVDSGKWTFDKFYSLYADIYQDLDGDAKRTSKDFYGLIEGGGYLNWFFAGGNRITLKDDNNRPYYDLLTERSTLTFSKASDMLLNDGVYRFDIWINVDIIPMFEAGRGIFLGTQIGSIPLLRGMTVDFGILPYPKLNEEQETYNNFIDGHSSFMAVPTMVSEKEKVGAIVEALSYESHKKVVPAYFDVALKTKFARDNESEKMIDLIFRGSVYDFDYVFCDFIVTYRFFDNLKDGKTNFVSDVEKNMNAAQARLDKVIAAFDEIIG